VAHVSLIEGRTGPWEVVIGLEVHAQVVSESKLFSGASTAFGAAPNTQVSLVDAAMPGMLPVINERAVEQAVRTGLGLKAEINMRSVFDRKNYFYPDLPAGYQISQYLQPIVGKGEIVLDMPDGATRKVGITRLHLEQDAGKSLHDRDPNKSYVDLNRAGVALMEIVSEPDLRSAEEAALYLAKLRSILRYLGTCDGNMEEGSLRCDANVSVRKPGGALNTRCEIKNVNSIRFLRQAIDYEARRQIELIEDGGEVVQETRLFDARKGETRSMRSKEFAHDYRYFPDPDLLPLELDADWVAEIKSSLPELPDEKRARFKSQYGISADVADVLVGEREDAEYFEAAAKGSEHARSVANLIVRNLFAEKNRTGKSLREIGVKPEHIARVAALAASGEISGPMANTVMEVLFEGGKSPDDIVAEKGLKQVTDTGEIEAVVDQVLAANPKQAEQFRSGDQKVVGWIVGQVMRASGGKANPKLVNDILKKKQGG
jgi:aspartyl-tRNA(Asn)/glutamyl-tRNA(Gln) amidotransferase subunit B